MRKERARRRIAESGYCICYSDVVPVRGLERLINLLEKNAISEIGEAEFEALVVFLSCLLATKNA